MQDGAAVPRAERGEVRVLVVEDDPGIRDLLHLHLENAGYEVVGAEDAIAAGYALLERPTGFALVIIDAHLPYLSGIEFASTLIADTSLPPIPIILISGHQELADRADVLGVPCLRKPFYADKLIELVEETLGESVDRVRDSRQALAGIRVGAAKATLLSLVKQ